MPRIPTRTEPHTSPARQQRHFKSKRDRTLKALGSASYINGSQFAIMLVSAKGEVETYASELFKSKLTQWFNDTIKSEVNQIVLDDKINRANPPRHHHPVDAEIDDEDGEVYSVSDDVFNPAGESSLSANDRSLPVTPNGSPAPPPSIPHHRLQLSAVDIALANQKFANRIDVDEHSSATLTPLTSDTPASFTSGLSISALDEWFCNQFHRLQQTTTKLVAKCWIKVIEPKKQNKFPYQKGDASKPDWWPQTLRHKEPDHLLKAERNSLLLAVLNSGRVPIARLELSTAEAMAQIDGRKLPILREIYDMAKEQEMRRKDPSYQPRIPLTFVAATSREGSPVEDKDPESAASTSGEQALWAHHLAQALQHQPQHQPEQKLQASDVVLVKSEGLPSISSTPRRRVARTNGRPTVVAVPSESPSATVGQTNGSGNLHTAVPIERAISQPEFRVQSLTTPWGPSSENQYPMAMGRQTYCPLPFHSFAETTLLQPSHTADSRELPGMLLRANSAPMVAPHHFFQLPSEHQHFVGATPFTPISPNSAAAAHWMMQWGQLPEMSSQGMSGFAELENRGVAFTEQRPWQGPVQIEADAIMAQQEQPNASCETVQPQLQLQPSPSYLTMQQQEGEFDQMTASWLLSSAAS
ncbi:hypothetical protein FRB95_011688 [Tulasnella sp. JGI-2019a]|nr:hypothetical protein FRB95_011688 [Tulasnella sp. JGI-2019a]